MRSFIAIKPPDKYQQLLANICFGLQEAHWISKENFHITLRFLGDVDNIQLGELDQELARINFPAFELGYQDFGYFESRGNIHTLWVAIIKNKALEELQSKVESSIRNAGIVVEHRKFTPHVTLARCKRTNNQEIGRFIEAYSPLVITPIMIKQFSLFKSFITHEGANYQEIASYSLQMPVSDISEQPD